MSEAIKELVARLESASEGSRELDARVWAALNGLVFDRMDERERHGRDALSYVWRATNGHRLTCWGAQAYTRSADAAEQLTADLPEAVIEATIDRSRYARVVLSWGYEDDCTLRRVCETSAMTYPLALTAAALRARTEIARTTEESETK